MTDAGYVIGGWTLTAVVIAGYTGRVWARTRRVRRLLPPDETDSRATSRSGDGGVSVGPPPDRSGRR